MRTELFIARRLNLRNGGKAGAPAPGVTVAVAGVAISFIVMLAAICIVTGFREQITARIRGFEQQITVTVDPTYGARRVNGGITLNDTIAAMLLRDVPGGEVSMAITQPAVLKTDTDFQGIVIKGIEPTGSDSAFIAGQITAGQMLTADSVNTILISDATARTLSLSPGDRIFTHFIIGDNLLTRRLRVSGIYNTHFAEYDRNMAFAPIGMLRRLTGTDSLTASEIQINSLPADKVEETASLLQMSLAEYGVGRSPAEFYRVSTVRDGGAVYFSWLDLIDTNVVVILVLMGCVAGFTLISSLFVIILQRVRTIGLLKAIGSTDRQIREVFILMAVRLVVIGLLAGNLIALPLLYLQQKLHIVPLDPESYYLDFVPVDVSLTAVIALNIAVAVISFALLIVPSAVISRLSPAETMRYE